MCGKRTTPPSFFEERADWVAIVAQVHTLLFRGTESEISLDAINVCGVER